MARIRTIKPEFFRHESLYEVERLAGLPLRLAFAGLWTAADREGRFAWQPRALKLDCLPYDDIDFSRVLDALVTHGFVVKYAFDGKEYGAIPSWHDHQHVNPREQESRLPPEPNENNTVKCDSTRADACRTRQDLARGEGKGREGKRNGREKKDTGKSLTLLPDDWLPSQVHFDLSEKLGLPRQQVEDAAAEMRGWSLGNGEKRRNWDWVFRNWLRRRGNKNGHGRPGSIQEDRSISRAAGRLAEAAERGEFGFGARPGVVQPPPHGNVVRLLPQGGRDES